MTDSSNTPVVADQSTNVQIDHTKSADLILGGQAFERIERFASLMATGKATVPHHFRGNIGDCMAVTMQAVQWGLNPFAVAQKTFLDPGGRLGYEGQLVSAVVSANAGLVNDPEYEYIGDWSKVQGKFEIVSGGENKGAWAKAKYTKEDEEGLGIIVRAQLRGEADPREIMLMLNQCFPRFSTQWATDPMQQIAYLAIRKWARRHKPGVILGIETPEELAEHPQTKDMGSAEVVSAWPEALLVTARGAAAQGIRAYQEFWKGLSPELQSKLVGTPEHADNKSTSSKVTGEGRTAGATDATVKKTAPTSTADEVKPDMVLKRINEAKTEDELYIALDLSNGMSEKDRNESNAMLEEAFNQRLEKLRG